MYSTVLYCTVLYCVTGYSKVIQYCMIINNVQYVTVRSVPTRYRLFHFCCFSLRAKFDRLPFDPCLQPRPIRVVKPAVSPFQGKL